MDAHPLFPDSDTCHPYYEDHANCFGALRLANWTHSELSEYHPLLHIRMSYVCDYGHPRCPPYMYHRVGEQLDTALFDGIYRRELRISS